MSEQQVPIECRRLAFAYRGQPAATCDVSLTLRAGDLFCLLGPNGAGKTTLIRQIIGDLRPSSGQVRVFGMDPARSQALVKRRMGVIPQTVGLFENLSVMGHLDCFAAIKGVPQARRRAAIDEVVQSCGLVALLSRPARALSGGQQRSVLVALALLGDPDVLILDEPTVGLDPVARRAIWEAVEIQRRRGRTILLTTHHLEEAERLATRIGFMKRGVLTHQGALSELVDLMGCRVKLREGASASGEDGAVHLLGTVEQAQELARRKGLDSYSVSPVSLEDVYFRLAGEDSVELGGAA
jgi:ABC-2 type transport system ATP-binding protein